MSSYNEAADAKSTMPRLRDACLRHANYYLKLCLDASAAEWITNVSKSRTEIVPNVQKAHDWAAAAMVTDDAACDLFCRYPLAIGIAGAIVFPQVTLTEWHEGALQQTEFIIDADVRLKYQFECTKNLGQLYFEQGDLKRSPEYLDRAEGLARAAHDRASEGRVLGMSGQVWSQLGDSDAALSRLTQSLAIAAELQDHLGVGRCFAVMGDVYLGLGRNKEAVEYFVQCWNIACDCNYKQLKVSAMMGVASAYCNSADYDLALKFCQECLELTRLAGDKAHEAQVHGLFGVLRFNLGKFADAQLSYQASFDLAAECNDAISELRALLGLGACCFAAQDYALAEQHQNKALQMAAQLGDRGGEAQAHHGLSMTFAKLGQESLAMFHSEQSMEIFLEIKSPFADSATAWLETLRRSRNDRIS